MIMKELPTEYLSCIRLGDSEKKDLVDSSFYFIAFTICFIVLFKNKVVNAYKEGA